MARSPSRADSTARSALPPDRSGSPRRGLRSRGGGWLLPDPPLPGPDDADSGFEPRAPGRALAHLEAALDARSSLDRCRWLRLAAEAGRWV